MKVSEKPPRPDTYYDPVVPCTDSHDAYGGLKTAPSCQWVAICAVGELFGGVERHILGILGGMREHGVAPLAIFFHDSELATQAHEQGFEPIILPNSNWSLLVTSRQLASIFEQRKIQIVHVHGYKATIYCALARLWYPFILVKTEHGLPEPKSDRPIQELRDHLYHFLSNMATKIVAATVCCVTQDLVARYRNVHFGLRVEVIPNGVAAIDRSRLQRPPELCESQFNLVVVGRLDTVKGHHLAIEAIASKALDPKLNPHLYIVGIGPCESSLRALAKTRNIMHRVHFLGYRRNVYDYIAHCHALLMPSLHEGLPYTLLEAMALGTPVIASRIGGLAETLQDGVTALLFPPGDVIGLAQAIGLLHDDPDLGRRLSGQAQHLQQAKYSSDAMTERYLDVYRKLLLTADKSTAC